MATGESLLDLIRERPVLYLGAPSLTALHHFLQGYWTAVYEHGIPYSDCRVTFPDDFHDWVAYRLHFEASTSGWWHMILDRVGSEEKALARFFTLLDEHRTRQPHLVAKVLDIRGSYEQISGDITETLPWPSSLSVVTYTDDPGFFVLSDTPDRFPGLRFYPCIDWFESFVAKRERLTVVDPKWNYGIKPEKLSG